jgi:MFS family permease
MNLLQFPIGTKHEQEQRSLACAQSPFHVVELFLEAQRKPGEATMSYRATYYYRAQAVVWAFLAFLSLSVNVAQYNIQGALALSLVVAGAITGGGLGAIISQRHLRFLERQCEKRVALSTILYIIGAFFVVVSFTFLFAPNIPLESLVLAWVFVSPMPAASFAVSAVIFSNWERRNKRRIFTIIWPGGLYATPKTN